MTIRHRIAVFGVGFTLLLCSTLVSAQEIQRRTNAATKFDEYGRVGGCDHSARLDNFAISLQNDPNLEGLLVYYGPESASEPTLAIIRDYLVNSRGLAGTCLKTTYAGPNDEPHEPRVQLWLLPPGVPAPELPRYESKIETFNGLYDESQAWEAMPLFQVGEATGPPVPDVSAANFVEMLKQRPDTVAYIVGFNGTEAAPGAWRRAAQQDSERLQRSGIAADRVRIIYGGSARSRVRDSEITRIQLWILPASAPPPVADAGPELSPSTTLQIGTFDDYGLGDEPSERWAFKVVLDALQTSAELRVCIIVRRAQEEEETEGSEAVKQETQAAEVKVETPPIPASLAEATSPSDEVAELQPADVLDVLEKWKSELTVKHKISADRLVVLFANPREFDSNALEAWVVPPGAALPDPNAEPVEEANEAAAEEANKETGATGVVIASPVESVTPVKSAAVPVEVETDKGGVQSEDGKSAEGVIKQTQTKPSQPGKKNPPR